MCKDIWNSHPIVDRINQHGPNSSGRRGNGSWKNLNRDFSKLDTPENRAVVKVMNDYDVSLYITSLM